jgi:NCS2 family nucleobase:cation symporter-2
MRKPHNLSYGVDDTPPLRLTALTGLQHVGLMAVYLVYPALVAKAAGSSPEVAASFVSATLVALALGTLLQAVRFGPVGSGFLCQPVSSVVYFVPSLIAVRHGGLGAVVVMTMITGVLEIGLARMLRRLRPVFTAEIAGLVVLLVGMASGSVGLRTALGAMGQSAPGMKTDLGLALFTLAIMVALNVWGRGAMRIFCMLIGMTAGYVAAWAFGRLGGPEGPLAIPAFALPGIAHGEWRFDPTLLLPFGVAAVAASLKVIGNVTACQKLDNADWVRADMKSISRGMAGDGLAAVVAGALGGFGVNSSTANVGLASATGITSRRIAYAIAAILFVLAFVPQLGLFFYLMPRPVAGAALVFSSTFITVTGLEIITSRLLDTRKTLIIGFALIFGIAVEVSPTLLDPLPAAARLSLNTSLVLGTLVALGLNVLFRLGVRQTATLTVAPDAVDSKALREFMEAQGGLWGARREVIERASFSLAQSLETIASSGVARGPLKVAATFDEFNLDLRVSYDGTALELSETRPTPEEILDSEDGERRLAGFMLRQFADRVAVSQRGERTTVLFHFDH